MAAPDAPGGAAAVRRALPKKGVGTLWFGYVLVMVMKHRVWGQAQAGLQPRLRCL